MIGHPRFELGDVVLFKTEDGINTGFICTVDADGRFDQSDDAYYVVYSVDCNILWNPVADESVIDRLGSINETDRILLRPFVHEDYEAMYNNWAADKRVTQYLTWEAHENVLITVAVIDNWIKEYKENNRKNWAIVLKEKEEPIGSISVINEEKKIINSGYYKTAEIGYCIGANWWRQGLMTETVRRVLWFLFGTMGYDEVIAVHDTENVASGEVMKKAGMTFDRIGYNEGRNNRGVVDIAIYRATRKEWLNGEVCKEEIRSIKGRKHD